jgi:hypothetical protein
MAECQRCDTVIPLDALACGLCPPCREIVTPVEHWHYLRVDGFRDGRYLTAKALGFTHPDRAKHNPRNDYCGLCASHCQAWGCLTPAMTRAPG